MNFSATLEMDSDIGNPQTIKRNDLPNIILDPPITDRKKEVEVQSSLTEESLNDDNLPSLTAKDIQIQNDVLKKVADEFRLFAVESSIKMEHVERILKIFKPVCPILPLTYATFVNISKLKPYQIKTIEKKAKFVYFGIRRQLKNKINVNLHPENTEFKLQINVDGLPIFQSSGREFWPILGHINFSPSIYKPFVIALYFGRGKPPCLEQFLGEFIDEFNDIQENGFEVDGKKFRLSAWNFVCDIPARVYIKNIKGHTGYYSCERCNSRGFSLNHCTIFPFLHEERRTDMSFRLQIHPQHHKGESPLCRLRNIDLVKDFVMDNMHLVYLGLMKKLLCSYWSKSKYKTKLKAKDLDRLGERINNLNLQIPVEFQRTAMSWEDLQHWKATHFRFMVLYAGPFVLKNVLPSQLYRHFMLLHAAQRILNSQKLHLKECDLAQFYLERFCLAAQHIYGFTSQGMNMHVLGAHLVDDVRRFECTLDEMSAFKMENALGEIKRHLNSGFKPVEQHCRSVLEHELLDIGKPKMMPKPFEVLSFKQTKDDICIINKLKYSQFKLTAKSPNNVVLLKNGTIISIDNIFTTSNDFEDLEKIKVSGNIVDLDGPAYEYPTNSALFDIYRVKKTSDIQCTFLLEEIKKKMFFLNVVDSVSENENSSDLYVIPLLHSDRS